MTITIQRDEPMLYCVDTSNGRCLVEAYSERAVRRYLKEEYGRSCVVKSISTELQEIMDAKTFGASIHYAHDDEG
jgi:reverse gyrase